MLPRLFSIIGVLFLLVACSSITPTQTAAPTASPTPVESKVWEAPPVLVEYYIYPSPIQISSFMPTVVLYSDGRILVTHENWLTDSSGNYSGRNFSMVEAQLSHTEICEFLQQFVVNGYFDPKATNFEPSQSTDQPTSSIAVESWMIKHVFIYDFENLATDEATAGHPINPELPNTVSWLENYVPPNSQPYQPDKLALFAWQFEPESGDVVYDWDDPDLELSTVANTFTRTVSVEGDAAQRIYSRFGSTWSKFYQEKGITYAVSVKPIVPLLIWDPATELKVKPYSYPTTPTRHMDCTGY